MGLSAPKIWAPTVGTHHLVIREIHDSGKEFATNVLDCEAECVFGVRAPRLAKTDFGLPERSVETLVPSKGVGTMGI